MTQGAKIKEIVQLGAGKPLHMPRTSHWKIKEFSFDPDAAGHWAEASLRSSDAIESR
jgi:hypothetical protein